jgi:hypothetical protein
MVQRCQANVENVTGYVNTHIFNKVTVFSGSRTVGLSSRAPVLCLATVSFFGA